MTRLPLRPRQRGVLARRHRRIPSVEPLEGRLALSAAPLPASGGPAEVVLIDAGVRDAAVLAAGLAPGAAVHYLRADGDGVAQAAAILSRYEGLEAVHVLSHGGAGSVTLGSATLDTGSLDAYADLLRGWGGALSPNGDILFYGCDAGAGDAGAAFLSGMASLTAADVAGSTDATGAAARGGDWQLEHTYGVVEADVVVGLAAQQAYQRLLADPVAVNNTATTNEDTAVTTVDVLANDTLGDTPTTISAFQAASAQGGTVVRNADNTFTYTPRANFTGTDTFTYTIRDTDGQTSTATVTVTVTAVNDAPAAGGGVSNQPMTDKATILPFTTFTITDAEASQTLTVTIRQNHWFNGTFTAASLTGSGFTAVPSQTLQFRRTGTAAEVQAAIRQLVFDATENHAAASFRSTFTVFVNDGVATQVRYTRAWVLITSVNDAPTVTGTKAEQPTVDEDSIRPFSDVKVSDADNPDQTLSVTVQQNHLFNGTFTSESLTASGFVGQGGGKFVFVGKAQQATTAVRKLVWQPTQDQVAVGAKVTTSFTVTVTDGTATTEDTKTSVVVTSAEETAADLTAL